MKLSKVLSIITVVLMLTLSVSNCAYALNVNPNTITPSDTTGLTEVRTLGGKIIGVMQTVGTIIAVAILAVLGIKYMMGSAAEKAEYKKTMIPYIIGALLIFGAVWVAGIVFNVVQGLK